jgi:hypothetical protein
MPILRYPPVTLRPIVAETGPIGVGAPTPTPTPPTIPTSLFVIKHNNFIDQIESLNRGFTRSDIFGFTPEELEEHIVIALQDNYIIEDGDNTGHFMNGQVAWRHRELTKGYVYERLY